jgi:putative ABC transport system ATP-binding protein
MTFPSPNQDHSEPLLELRGLSKVYREGQRTRSVLSNVNARIFRKEFVVLLGPSGCGKSTLLNLISGIDVPTSGRVQFEAADLTAMSDRDRTLFRRKNIGFVFQFFNLLPTLTVMENLLLPLNLNGVTGKIAGSRAADLLGAVGLADRGRSFPDRLSGGEQQRVAIARALVHDPPLVLADEPTGNLDADTGAQVMGLLDALVRQRGKSMVVVTHSADVVGLADRLYLLRDGTLREVLKDDPGLWSAISRGTSRVFSS